MIYVQYVCIVEILYQYQRVFHFVGIGSTHPLPHWTRKEEEQHSLASEGLGGGGPNSDDWKESLALCNLYTLRYCCCLRKVKLKIRDDITLLLEGKM
jgi:hypothetical protein